MHLAGATLEWFQKGPLLSLRFQRRGADLFVLSIAFIRAFMVVEAFLSRRFHERATNGITRYSPCALA